MTVLTVTAASVAECRWLLQGLGGTDYHGQVLKPAKSSCFILQCVQITTSLFFYSQTFPPEGPVVLLFCHSFSHVTVVLLFYLTSQFAQSITLHLCPNVTTHKVR